MDVDSLEDDVRGLSSALTDSLFLAGAAFEADSLFGRSVRWTGWYLSSCRSNELLKSLSSCWDSFLERGSGLLWTRLANAFSERALVACMSPSNA